MPSPVLAYLAGFAVSEVGNGFFRLAVPWLVYSHTHSALAMGVLSTLVCLPGIAIPWIGAVFDRRDIRSVLLITVAAQLLCAGLLAMLVASASAPLWRVYAAAILLTGLNMTAGTGSRVLIARTSAGDPRIAANALLSNLYNVSWYVSPGLAGIVIAHAGVAAALGANAASYLFALVPILLLPRAVRRGDPPRLAPPPRTALSDGFAILRGASDVFALTAALTFWNVLWNGVYALEVFFLRGHLHFGASLVGLVETLAGVVPLAIGLFGPVLVRAVRPALLIAATFVVSGLGMAGLDLARTWPEAMLALGFMTGANAPVSLAVASLTQERIPPAFYGRVAGLQATMTLLGASLPGVFAGILAGLAGAPFTIAAFGVATVAAGIALPFTPARSARIR